MASVSDYSAEHIAEVRERLGVLYSLSLDDVKSRLRDELLGAADPYRVSELGGAVLTQLAILDALADLKPAGE